MADSNFRLFAAELRRDIPTLDLHEISPAQALEQLELFLYHLLEIPETEARIIYGIGTGRLREQVLAHLKHHSLIDVIHEASGSCVVLLK